MDKIKHFDNDWSKYKKDFENDYYANELKFQYYPHYYNINEFDYTTSIYISNKTFLINIKNFNKSNLFNLLNNHQNDEIAKFTVGVLLAENHLKVSNIFNHNSCCIDNLYVIIKFSKFCMICDYIYDEILTDVEFSIIKQLYNDSLIYHVGIRKYTIPSINYKCIYFVKKNGEISFIHPFAIKSYNKLTNKNLFRRDSFNDDIYNLSLIDYNITGFDKMICIYLIC
jgi:hypothetical protein